MAFNIGIFNIINGETYTGEYPPGAFDIITQQDIQMADEAGNDLIVECAP